MRQTRRMRGNGATRNSIAGADVETRKRGDPGNRDTDAAEDQRPGATQSLIIGSAEGCGFEATRNSTQQAQPEERRSGATRRFTTGIAGRCGKRGNPNSHQPASRGKRSFGATRGFNLGKAGRSRIRGDPGGLIERRHWRAKIRGNPEIRRQRRRMMRDSVRTGDPSPAKAGRRAFGATRQLVGKQYWCSEYAGRPGFLKPVLLKDARVEATRNSIAGTA